MEIDRELVVRGKPGETQAQEELVAILAPMVFRLASRFFRSREDVEDLSQEAFIRFFDKIDRVRPGDNVAGWVSRVTINVCYDRLRKLRREKLAFEEYRAQPSSPSAPADYDYEWVWTAVNNRRSIPSGSKTSTGGGVGTGNKRFANRVVLDEVARVQRWIPRHSCL